MLAHSHFGFNQAPWVAKGFNFHTPATFADHETLFGFALADVIKINRVPLIRQARR